MTFADSAGSCASVLDTRFRSISASALPRRTRRLLWAAGMVGRLLSLRISSLICL